MPTDTRSTQERLLDAAEQLFSRKCFEEVSVRELAAAAEVNPAAVNYHFQGKDNLFRQVILRRFTRQRDTALAALEAALAQAEGKPRLEQVIEAMVRAHLTGALGPDSSGSFLSLIIREMQGAQTHAHEAFFKEMVDPVFQAFSRALMAAQPCLRQEDLNWIIASIVGQIHHFIFRWNKKQTLEEDSVSYRTMLRLFPPLALPVDQYIQAVTGHITRFSSAAIQALHPEVE